MPFCRNKLLCVNRRLCNYEFKDNFLRKYRNTDRNTDRNTVRKTEVIIIASNEKF